MSRLVEDDAERGKVIEEKVVKVSGQVTVRSYTKGRFLGKGGFARCYELTNIESKKVTAAKIVPKASLTKARAKQKLMSEIKIHRSLHHPHIVGFEHFFEDAENVYILLELCTNQTLNELLRRRKRLTELEVQSYALQVLSALKYLRTHRVIHRDLKLGNIFINDKMEIKLGDFGLATRLEFEGEKKRTICGTPNYIAPEVLDGKQGHSYEVDIWSLGVIIYTLIVGKPPFETSDVKTTYRRIRMNSYVFPEHVSISQPAKNLITAILVTDPLKRPSLEDIQAHEFFHQGNSIPPVLPPSTLACPPSAAYLRQFLNPGTSLAETPNTRSMQVLPPAESRLPSRQASQKTLPAAVPRTSELWIKKWVDYSSKYGVGYMLSNGCIGVFFNDSTKITLSLAGHKFNYTERKGPNRQDSTTTYLATEYPPELQKKVTLLHHFKSYLEGEEAAASTEPPAEPPTVYVKKWMKTKHAIMFRLSSKVVQVIFQDRTEIILSSEKRSVTYVNKKGERSAHPLATALESTNQEMTKRLKYTKDILTHMLSHPKATS